jgi:sialate O-acetylesterase
MKKTNILKAILFLFALLIANGYQFVHGAIKLPAIFSDNMVLQREMELKVWGWANAGERVTVLFNGQKVRTKAIKDGTWQIQLKPMKAGGPHDMQISGKNEIILKNILIGDVWICSGQSNMAFWVQRSNNAEVEIKNAYYPEIRLLTVPRKVSNVPLTDIGNSSWQICNPETVAEFSAVSYFFGRDIHKETGIPIGLINTSWGGTHVETWTSAASISKLKNFEWAKKKLADYKMVADSNANPNELPGLLYNGMLHPLIPFGIKGVIWYQGESNAGRAFEYRTTFPNMINNWREDWGQGNFPFLFVQLANFMELKDQPGEDEWAELREAQLLTLQLPNTGIAVTIDIGEANDIHPRNKQDVGKRLALSALKVAYNKDIVYSGPIYKSMQVEGDKVRLSFEHTGSGLIVHDKYGYLKGFTIAGADRKFHWAKACLEGNEVVVWSEEVKNPVAVRYGWAINPDDVNIYNKEGLPASPFRTDTWPGITEGKTFVVK